jgi:hypothetical protein
VKVAVYDLHWPTGGGGEKFAAGIAAALAPDHDVRLLAHEPLDRAWLGERLDLDLGAVAVDVVADELGVAAASEAYDLFVNASYLSWDANRARHGLFVVHFPGPRPDRAERSRRWLAARAGPVLDSGGATGSTRRSRRGSTASAGRAVTPICSSGPRPAGRCR